MEKGDFINGNGEVIDYYENGKIFSKKKYENGYLNGRHVSFFPNGKIAEDGIYINAKKVGTWIKYNRKGVAISSIRYENEK